MDYFRDPQRPYGRHEDYDRDVDGPPPPDYPFQTQPPSRHLWAPPSFRGGPEYYTSPPRGDYRRYPHGSPERRRAPHEDYAPPGFARDPGYAVPPPEGYPPPGGYPPPDYAGGPPHGSGGYPPPDYAGGPSHGSDYGRHGGIPADYGRGGYPPEEYDRRPPPEYEYERRSGPDYERRAEPEYERGPPGYEPAAEHPGDGQRYGGGIGFPPPPYEPAERRDALPIVTYPPPPYEPVERRDAPPIVPYPPPPYEPVERRDAPPIVPYPPPPDEYHPRERARSPAHPPAEANFPPMPYEPAAASPPPLHAAHDAPHDHHHAPHDHHHAPGADVHFPPMPYEPVGRSPDRPAHHHPLPDGYPPQMSPRMEGPGDDGAVPYTMSMGVPHPYEAADHYGQATEHGHIKRNHLQGCKDYWACFLFLLHFWAVIGVCIYLGVMGVIKTNRNNDLKRAHSLAPAPSPPLPDDLYNIRNWAPQLGAATASGWLFAFIWQSLIRRYPETMIKVCLSLGAVATGLLGIILISTGTAKGLVGLIFLVAALFQGLYVHLVRQRIPFAALMLSKALLVVHRYKSLYLISMWTVFLAMFWLAVWIFGVSGAVSFPYGGFYAALLILSMAWSMEVLRNVVNVTVSRVVGTRVYYEEQDMPHFPVWRGYQRAWTISFGSICLGSLFVTPVQTLHAIAKRLANEQGENEFLFSCVNCFLGVLEYFIKHFNKWAFVGVGLHGKSFVRSAKETWEMFDAQRVMLLIDDDLTGAVLLTGCIIGGVVTALVGGCWTFATHRYLTVGVSIISFFIGFFVTYLTMAVSESAVAAYYVCFANDPETLRKHDAALFQYMDLRKQGLNQEVQ